MARDEDDLDEDGYEDELGYSDEDEDDQRDGPRKKKRKKQGNGFLDLEAEEDDAEDDDEEAGPVRGLFAEDGDDADVEAANEVSRARTHRLLTKQALESDDHAELERYVKDRYDDADHDYDDGQAAQPQTTGIDQQSLLPTIRDPRLYVVRCRKPGHERRAILTLLQKSFNLKKRNVDLGILSAVAPDHLKGIMYIEAYSSAQVEQAINGLDLFASYNGVKALRLDEMTDVLKVGKRMDKQVPGNWVRRNRGIYKGDLAQVCEGRDGNEGKVTIRMIPRLDLKGERDFMENAEDDYDDDEDDAQANGFGLNGKKKGRPPQKLFDKKELYRLTGSADVFTQRDRQTGEIFEVWNGERYRFGLLYQIVSIKTLTVGDAVQPQVEELERWMAAEERMRAQYQDDPSTMTAEEARIGLNLKLSSSGGTRKSGLFKGDSVVITKGEQKGLSGVISGFDGDVVLMKTPEFPEALRVSRGDLIKSFKVGDNVKIASGNWAGHAGAIVAVEGEFLTVFTDSTREEVRVLSSCVADSSDLNSDIGVAKSGLMQSKMHYELFDLVQLQSDMNEKGVVIKVQNDGIKILTSRNQERTVALSEVKCKVRDTSARAMDFRGNPIARNDTIYVVSGTLKDRQGIVEHVADSTVFFKARDETKHCGIIAVPASACTAKTAAARRLTSTMTSSKYKPPAPIPRGSIASLGSMGGGGRGDGGPRSRDPLLRKEVKVTKGPWKGYRGKVVYADDKNVRVELSSKMKTVSISRDKVLDVGLKSEPGGLGQQGSLGRGFGGGFGSGYGRSSSGGPDNSASRPPHREGGFMQTPAHGPRYNSGNRTPGHWGGATPSRSYGGATPSRTMTPSRSYGGSTPRSSAFSRAGTPGRPDAFRPATPGRADDYSGFGSYSRPAHTPMPMTPADSANAYGPYSRPNVPQTPATPGEALSAQTPMGAGYGIVEPRTPAMINEPNTPAPGGLEPRTPAPVMEPNTPAMMMEPHTPAPPMEPATPMVHEPTTPHTPAMIPQTPQPEAESDAGQIGYKVLIDVVVSVRQENGVSGVVADAAVDGSHVVVKMLDGDKSGQVLKVDGSDITPVQPRSEVTPDAYEMVKVLDGHAQGRIGMLTSVNTNAQGEVDGLIKFENGGVEMLSLALVAKYHSSK